jgi:hypothetical protein
MEEDVTRDGVRVHVPALYDNSGVAKSVTGDFDDMKDSLREGVHKGALCLQDLQHSIC